MGCCCGIPKRYVVILLTCCGMLLVHAMRVNVAVTVVTIIDKAPHTKVGTVEAMQNLPDMEWTPSMIGFLHAIFHIGYFFTQLPGGYLATKIPPNRLFGGCILLSCALNLLLPTAFDKVGYIFTCVIRLLQGLSEGLLFPSCYAILRHWTMIEERSRMGAIVLTGVYIGPVIGLMASGWLTHYLGWQYVFYTHGAVGILWFIFWLFIVYETPDTHPGISPEELKLIKESQGLTAVVYKEDKVPWKEIFMSMPVAAISVCNFGRSFVFFFLLTNGPTFLNVFGYSLVENGVLSALPHALMAFMAVISGPIADYLIKNPMLSTTQVRKIFTCVGFAAETVCLYCLCVINDGTTAMVFLTIGVGISGFTISGWQINHLDLAPRYASVLVAISTAVGVIAGIINPILVGAMTTHQTIEEWHMVFVMTGSVLASAVVFYLIFGSGELQSWAEPRHLEKIVPPTLSPADQKPYGTFPAQVDHSLLNKSLKAKLEGDGTSSPVSDVNGPDETNSASKDLKTNDEGGVKTEDSPATEENSENSQDKTNNEDQSKQ